MHELGIAASILDAVRAELAHRNGARAVKVGLRVGEVSGVDRDSLCFCFEALVKGSDLEPLELDIEFRPLTNRCPACGTAFPVVDFNPVCPECGCQETVRAGGDELEIAYLDLEEP